MNTSPARAAGNRRNENAEEENTISGTSDRRSDRAADVGAGTYREAGSGGTDEVKHRVREEADGEADEENDRERAAAGEATEKQEVKAQEVTEEPAQQEQPVQEEKAEEVATIRPSKMGQPRKYDEQTKHVSFSLPVSVIENLKIISRLKGMNQTQFILSLIHDEMEKEKDRIEAYKKLIR